MKIEIDKEVQAILNSDIVEVANRQIDEAKKPINESPDFMDIYNKAMQEDVKVRLTEDYYAGSIDEWLDLINFEKSGDFSYEAGSVEGFEKTYKALLKSGALEQRGSDLYIKAGTEILFSTKYKESDITFKYSQPGNSFSMGTLVAFILINGKKIQWPTMDLWMEGLKAEEITTESTKAKNEATKAPEFRILPEDIDKHADKIMKILNDLFFGETEANKVFDAIKANADKIDHIALIGDKADDYSYLYVKTLDNAWHDPGDLVSEWHILDESLQVNEDANNIVTIAKSLSDKLDALDKADANDYVFILNANDILTDLNKLNKFIIGYFNSDKAKAIIDNLENDINKAIAKRLEQEGFTVDRFSRHQIVASHRPANSPDTVEYEIEGSINTIAPTITYSYSIKRNSEYVSTKAIDLIDSANQVNEIVNKVMNLIATYEKLGGNLEA